MRTFIIKARKGPCSGFNTQNWTGSKGLEMGLVCRSVSNAIWVSLGVRKDVIVKICLESGERPVTVVVDSSKAETLRCDEQNIAEHINKALRRREVPGITVERKSFEAVVREHKNIYFMDKKGTDIREAKISENPCFIIGDYIGIPKKTGKLLSRIGAEKISLGPVMLFASHCIVLINNELDRREFGRHT